MKEIIDWKKFLVFFLVAAGLVFLTRSFMMSLGIFILLLVGDHFLAEYEERKRVKKEIDDILKEDKHPS